VSIPKFVVAVLLVAGYLTIVQTGGLLQVTGGIVLGAVISNLLD